MAKRQTEDPTAEPLPIPDDLASSGFSEVQDRPIVSWKDVQGRVVGKLVGVRPAGLGNVADIQIAGEVVTYGCPRVLERKLTGMEGRTVAIECLGKTLETDNGLAYNFRVFFR